ncbi:MAG: hypothetical protein ACYSU0_12105 [Planctomycetota bacterium]
MTVFFTTIKGWQLLLSCSVPLLSISVIMHPSIRPLVSPNVLAAVAACGIGLPTVAVMSWLWALGVRLSRRASPGARIGRYVFTGMMGYAGPYMVVFFVLLGALAPLGLWILPFHLCAMVSLWYAVYYNAKKLAVAENGSDAAFWDCLGNMFWFMLGACLLGMLVVQPRINALFRDAAKQQHTTRALKRTSTADGT